MPPVLSSAIKPLLVVSIRRATDVVFLQRRVRTLAESLGFPMASAWQIAIAASEMATNILKYAGVGEIELSALKDRPGLEMRAQDRGPGIADLTQALRDQVTQGRDLTEPQNLDRPHSLGCGLPAIQRLMDTLEIQTAPGQGTTLVAWKYRP